MNFVLILDKLIFAQKLSGTTLEILPNKPPPVIFAHPLISFFSVSLLTSFT